MLVADIIAEIEMHSMTCRSNVFVRPLSYIFEDLGAAIATLGFLEHGLFDRREAAGQKIRRVSHGGLAGCLQ